MTQKSEILKMVEFDIDRAVSSAHCEIANQKLAGIVSSREECYCGGIKDEHERLSPILTQLLDAHERLRAALEESHDHAPVIDGGRYGNCTACVALAADDALLDKIARGEK